MFSIRELTRGFRTIQQTKYRKKKEFGDEDYNGTTLQFNQRERASMPGFRTKGI